MKLSGDRVRVARARKGHTQAETMREVRAMLRLAGRDQPPGSWLSRVETGRLAEVPEVEAVMLAAAIGCGLTELLDLTGVPATDPAVDLVAQRLGEELAEVRGRLDAMAEVWAGYLAVVGPVKAGTR